MKPGLRSPVHLPGRLPGLDVAAPPGLLRFLTCGSVDDGKSTLIGRLLFDTRGIPDDQLETLRRDSRRRGSAGDDLDLSLLVDGLEAEREQGITIDVAYRFFATPRRRFMVADTPGHEQYTRNMATGASNADLAVMLVDARKGVLTQTRRHAFIAGLMGIRHVVLAVNKIDLAGFSEARFEAIAAEFRASAAGLGFRTVQAIPLSARHGDNVATPSANTPWYAGPSLLSYLESVSVEQETLSRPFRMPVQWVNRPNLEFRGYSGTVASGHARPGQRVIVQPSGVEAEILRIVTMDGTQPSASAGDAVTFVLDREIDVSRGDVLAAADAPAEVADALAARLIWLHDTPLAAGREYLVKLGTRSVPGSVSRIRNRIDVNTREAEPAESLHLNDLGHLELRLQAPVAFEAYAESRDLGGFILIDRLTNATVGVGMVEAALHSATDITWQALDVDRAARGRLLGQRPAVLWFTGLSGAGKSTVANLVERRLHALGRPTYVLDGDNLRHGLNRDLGFSEADRAENVRRASEVAALFADAGLIVIASLISPYRAERARARERVPEGEFIEVFVDAPVDECRRRDPKGLYKKADAGLLRGLTGVDAPYEAPDAPELHLRTAEASPADLAERVVAELRRRGVFA
jgi:bifunctional enzyme CysN/CysC